MSDLVVGNVTMRGADVQAAQVAGDTGDAQLLLAPEWILALLRREVLASFTILGEPASKANSRVLSTIGPADNKRTILRKGNKALAYEEAALRQIPPRFRLRLEGPLGVRLRIFYATQRPDLDESIVLDVLQDRTVLRERAGVKERVIVQNGVYRNDRQVRMRVVEHGIDKHHPRTEIEVWRLQPVQTGLELPIAPLPVRADFNPLID
jgi:hypothetical protein